MSDIDKLILADLRENNWSIDSKDDALLKVMPHVVTVGCAFGSIVDVPIVRHQMEIDGEWCVECGYHHPLGQHEIPMAEAVAECMKISAALPGAEAKERIWQKVIKRLNS